MLDEEKNSSQKKARIGGGYGIQGEQTFKTTTTKKKTENTQCGGRNQF